MREDNGNFYSDLLLVKYDSDGDLDTSFGDDGVCAYVIEPWEGLEMYTQTTTIALEEPNGQILVGGTAGASYYASPAVVRIDGDGTLDPCFGVDGVFVGGSGGLIGMVQDSNNNILLATDSGKLYGLDVDGQLYVDPCTSLPLMLDFSTPLALMWQNANDDLVLAGQVSGGVCLITVAGFLSENPSSSGSCVQTTGLNQLTDAYSDGCYTWIAGDSTDGGLYVAAIGECVYETTLHFGYDQTRALGLVSASAVDGMLVLGTGQTLGGLAAAAVKVDNGQLILSDGFGVHGKYTNLADGVKIEGVRPDSNNSVFVVGRSAENNGDFAAGKLSFTTGQTDRIYVTHDSGYNITASLDAGGNVVERYTYAAYGAQTVYAADYATPLAESQIQMDLGWQGGEKSQYGKLVLFRKRFLNTSLCVWMSNDVLGYVDGGNRMQYERGNPFAGVDPMGTSFEDDIKRTDWTPHDYDMLAWESKSRFIEYGEKQGAYYEDRDTKNYEYWHGKARISLMEMIVYQAYSDGLRFDGDLETQFSKAVTLAYGYEDTFSYNNDSDDILASELGMYWHSGSAKPGDVLDPIGRVLPYGYEDGWVKPTYIVTDLTKVYSKRDVILGGMGAFGLGFSLFSSPKPMGVYVQVSKLPCVVLKPKVSYELNLNSISLDALTQYAGKLERDLSAKIHEVIEEHKSDLSNSILFEAGGLVFGGVRGIKGVLGEVGAGAAGWTRPSGWRLPKNGTWSGTAGHSDFIPTNPTALGLQSGSRVPFRNGYPDFSQWRRGNSLNVTGLNGDYNNDMPLIFKAVAKEHGMANQTAAKDWLQVQGLTPHHAGGNSVELVPSVLHKGVRHTGGAWELRNQ